MVSCETIQEDYIKSPEVMRCDDKPRYSGLLVISFPVSSNITGDLMEFVLELSLKSTSVLVRNSDPGLWS